MLRFCLIIAVCLPSALVGSLFGARMADPTPIDEMEIAMMAALGIGVLLLMMVAALFTVIVREQE